MPYESRSSRTAPSPPRTAPSAARPRHTVQPSSTAAMARAWLRVKSEDSSLAEKHIQLRDELAGVLDEGALPDPKQKVLADIDSANEMPRVILEARPALPRTATADHFLAHDQAGGWASRQGKPYQKIVREAAAEAALPPDVKAALRHVKRDHARERDIAKANAVLARPPPPTSPFDSEAHPALRPPPKPPARGHNPNHVHVAEAVVPDIAPLVAVLDRGLPRPEAEEDVRAKSSPVPMADRMDGSVVIVRDVRDKVRSATSLVADLERKYPDKPPPKTRAEREHETQERCSDELIRAIGAALGEEDEFGGGDESVVSGDDEQTERSPATSSISRRFNSNYHEIMDHADFVRHTVNNSAMLRRKSKFKLADGPENTDDDFDFDLDESMRRTSFTTSDQPASVTSSATAAKKAWRVLQTLVGGRTPGALASEATKRMQRKVARQNAEKLAKEQEEKDRLRKMREAELLQLKTALETGKMKKGGPSLLLAHLRKAVAIDKLKKSVAEKEALQPAVDLFDDIYRDQVGRSAGLLTLNSRSYQTEDDDGELPVTNTDSSSTLDLNGGHPKSPGPPKRAGSAGPRKVDRKDSLGPSPFGGPTVPTKRIMLERQPIPKSNGIYVIQEQPDEAHPVVEVFVANRSLSTANAQVSLDFKKSVNCTVDIVSGCMKLDNGRRLVAAIAPGDKKKLAVLTRDIVHPTWKRVIDAQLMTLNDFEKIRRELMGGGRGRSQEPSSPSVGAASPEQSQLSKKPSFATDAAGSESPSWGRQNSSRKSIVQVGKSRRQSATSTERRASSTSLAVSPMPPPSLTPAGDDESNVSPNDDALDGASKLRDALRKRQQKKAFAESVNARAAALFAKPETPPDDGSSWGKMGRSGGLALKDGGGSFEGGSKSTRRASQSNADLAKSLADMEAAQSRRRRESMSQQNTPAIAYLQKDGATPAGDGALIPTGPGAPSSSRGSSRRASVNAPGGSDPLAPAPKSKTPPRGKHTVVGGSGSGSSAVQGMHSGDDAEAGRPAAKPSTSSAKPTGKPSGKAAVAAKKMKLAANVAQAASKAKKPPKPQTNTSDKDNNKKKPPMAPPSQVAPPSLAVTDPSGAESRRLASGPTSPKSAPVGSSGGTSPKRNSGPPAFDRRRLAAPADDDDDDDVPPLFSSAENPQTPVLSQQSKPLPPPTAAPDTVTTGWLAPEEAGGDSGTPADGYLNARRGSRRVSRIEEPPGGLASAMKRSSSYADRDGGEAAREGQGDAAAGDDDDDDGWGKSFNPSQARKRVTVALKDTPRPPVATAAAAADKQGSAAGGSGGVRRSKSMIKRSKSFAKPGGPNKGASDGAATADGSDSRSGSRSRASFASGGESPPHDASATKRSGSRSQSRASRSGPTPGTSPAQHLTPIDTPGPSDRRPSVALSVGSVDGTEPLHHASSSPLLRPKPQRPDHQARTRSRSHVRAGEDRRRPAEGSQLSSADSLRNSVGPPRAPMNEGGADSDRSPLDDAIAGDHDDDAWSAASDGAPDGGQATKEGSMSSTVHRRRPRQQRPSQSGNDATAEGRIGEGGHGDEEEERTQRQSGGDFASPYEIRRGRDDENGGGSGVSAHEHEGGEPDHDDRAGRAGGGADADDDVAGTIELRRMSSDPASPRDATSRMSGVSNRSEAAQHATKHSEKFSNFLKQRQAMEGSVKAAVTRPRKPKDVNAVKRMAERIRKRAKEAAENRAAASSRRTRKAAGGADAAVATAGPDPDAPVDESFAKDPEEYAASVQGVIDGVLAELDKAHDSAESHALFAEHDNLTVEMQAALNALRNAPHDGSRETAAMREQLVLAAWVTQVRREFNMEKMLGLIERKLGHHGFMTAFLDDVVYVADDDIRKAHNNARTVGRYKFDRTKLVRSIAHVGSLRVAAPSQPSEGTLPCLTARAPQKPVEHMPKPPTLPPKPKALTARERYRKLHPRGLQLPPVPTD